MDQQTLQHTLPSRPHETTEDDVSGIHQERFSIMESMLILLSVQKVTHFYIMNILNFFSWIVFILDKTFLCLSRRMMFVSNFL